MKHAQNTLTGPEPFCLFRAGGMTFGIEASKVAEVVRGSAITPVPLADPEIRGLMNLRGQVVTVISLSRRLGSEGNPPPGPVQLILRTPGELLSLLVDEAGDVVLIDPGQFQDPPATVAPEVRRLIRGAYPAAGGLVLALRLEEALRLKNE
jgi:purine-binding chemotaxis protein CheW